MPKVKVFSNSWYASFNFPNPLTRLLASRGARLLAAAPPYNLDVGNSGILLKMYHVREVLLMRTQLVYENLRLNVSLKMSFMYIYLKMSFMLKVKTNFLKSYR